MSLSCELQLRRVSLTLLALSVLLCQVQGTMAKSDSQLVHCDRFGKDENSPLLILLHGVSGPAPFYSDQAKFFAAHGYRVVLPHYLDASHGQNATDKNYEAWVAAVSKVIASESAQGKQPPATFLVGYSLGASIALALGSQGEKVNAIAELYGSLPDKYFRDMKTMPPLLILHGSLDDQIPVDNATRLTQLCTDSGLRCDTHIYPSEGHGFAPKTQEDADRRILDFFSQAPKPFQGAHSN